MKPPRPVRILSPAELDIAGCIVQLAERNLSAASRFREAVPTTILEIARFPGAGLTYPFAAERLRSCRLWRMRGFEKWLILYRETPEAIEVMRVVHGARDLDALDE